MTSEVEEIIKELQRFNADFTHQISRALGLSDVSIRKWLAVLREQGTITATEAKTKSKNVRYRLTEDA